MQAHEGMDNVEEESDNSNKDTVALLGPSRENETSLFEVMEVISHLPLREMWYRTDNLHEYVSKSCVYIYIIYIYVRSKIKIIQVPE